MPDLKAVALFYLPYKSCFKWTGSHKAATFFYRNIFVLAINMIHIISNAEILATW